MDNLKQSDEKLVYVYDRLNNECKRKGHKVVTVTAQTVTIPDGDPIEANVFHCTDCDKYYVSNSALQKCIEEGIHPALNYYLAYDLAGNLKKASKLMLYGYNVQQGVLTRSERHSVLTTIINNGYISKQEIICDLQFFISYNGKKRGNEEARQKWQEDLSFVNHYVDDNTKIIKPRFVLKPDKIPSNRIKTCDLTKFFVTVPDVDTKKLPRLANNEKNARRRFPMGRRLIHERFGEGIVEGYKNNLVIIDFCGIGVKELDFRTCIDKCKLISEE